MQVEDERGSQMPIKACDTEVGKVYESKDGGCFYIRTDEPANIRDHVCMVQLETGETQVVRFAEFYPCPNCTLVIK